MTKRLYTKKIHKYPVRGLVTGLGGLGLCGYLVRAWEPNIWWKEVLVMLIAYLSVSVIGSWMFKNLKTGGLISTGLFGLLILNRLAILEPVSGILLLLVLVLIALVN